MAGRKAAAIWLQYSALRIGVWESEAGQEGVEIRKIVVYH